MVTIGTARPNEWTSAFQLVFQHLQGPVRATRVANAERLVLAGDLDAAGILVARDGAALCGAVVCVALAGAGGLLWPPNLAPNAAVADQLVSAGLSWLRQRGAKVVQALLTPQESSLGAPLERAGVRRVTSLQYMRHDLRHLQEALQLPADTTLQTYDQSDAAVFQETLLRSYEGSQDCPELNGVRTAEEIIAGHKAQGEFDPRRWWLVSLAQRPAGVLLLTKVFDESAWDLSYVGVVPEARRRGLARALTQLALRQTRAAGAKQLTLAVDVRNPAAQDLYANLGFHATESREVLLALLRDG